MKKWVYFFLSLIILTAIFIFIKYYYYPPLPMHSFSKIDALNKVKTSSGHIVKLGNKYSYQWYISDNKYEDEIKKVLKEKGWDFEKREGGNYFFHSKQGDIAVLGVKWNKKDILFYFPKDI